MQVCGASDRAFSQKLQQLCAAIEQRHGATLRPRTAALAFEGMIDGLWQNFLVGEPGFKREDALAAVFELIEAIYPGSAD